GDTPPPATQEVAGVELPPKSPPFNLYQAAGGSGAVRKISLRLEADDLPQALRSTVLVAEFDGEQTVWCPVGDFFGTGHQVHPFRSWYTGVADDGTMTCFWVMPHEKSCRVSVVNLGSRPVRVTSQAQGSVYDWTDRSMHFHATWHQLTKVDTGPKKDQTGQGAFDVNYVTIQGEGKIVGDTLTVFNGAAAWWGEGDEKIFIDGEEFPSHIGTGTEDYYGYAWCRPELFQSPFHAQPCGEGNLKGGFSVNSRYRILDTLPFTRSIRFDMELWHWASTRMNYAPAVFWYARPGATSSVKPDPEAAILPVPRKRSDVVELRKVPGVLEGEDLTILQRTGGETSVQALEEHNWSYGAQLWWIDGKPGDRLLLEVPVEQAGRYRVTADLTKAVDYGIVRMALNGRDAGRFDRFNNGVANDALDLGTFELESGKSRLEVEIVGANERAKKRHMFGLDYLKLEKAP
ncbi:MAG: glycoside hydrolase family 172 protein, partial [Thermoguttaceae bacterium]